MLGFKRLLLLANSLIFEFNKKAKILKSKKSKVSKITKKILEMTTIYSMAKYIYN